MIYNVTTMHGSKIMIGQRGENLATTIEIDVSEWLAKWPGSTFNVLVRRPGDIVPYVTSTSLSGNILRWPVTSTDTANAGLGKIEVRATLNGVIKKSAIATIGIAPCILCLENEQPPELDPAVADVALEAAVRAENAARASETARWNNVENLLRNSDFRLSYFIAQAGLNGKHGSMKYVGDGWISWDADATFTDEYMTTGSAIDQRIILTDEQANKTHTAVLYMADGSVKYHVGKPATGFGLHATIYCNVTDVAAKKYYVRIGGGQSVKHAALFEGEYTADTLPAYQYKGYAAELAECQRYYFTMPNDPFANGQTIGAGNAALFSIQTPVSMRVNEPTLDLHGGSLTIRCNGADYPVTALSQQGKTGCFVSFMAQAEGLPPKHACASYVVGGGSKVALSADL